MQITEIDMRSAGLNIIREDKLLPPFELERLESLSKELVSREVGLLARTDSYRNLGRRVTQGIKERIKVLCEYNDINQEDILSIKRDAIFVLGATPRYLELSKHTKFRIQNVYTTFSKLGLVEIYYDSNKKLIDYKGIDDQYKPLFEPYLFQFFYEFFDFTEKKKFLDAVKLLEQFRIDYVKKELPLEFYRELQSEACYAIKINNSVFRVEELEDLNKEFTDVLITYNLINVINPLANAIA